MQKRARAHRLCKVNAFSLKQEAVFIFISRLLENCPLTDTIAPHRKPYKFFEFQFKPER